MRSCYKNRLYHTNPQKDFGYPRVNLPGEKKLEMYSMSLAIWWSFGDLEKKLRESWR
jgi:hypothetical protein